MTNEITRDEFEAYEKVRRSGKFNMIMEATDAADAAGLDRDRYMLVIKNYTSLAQVYLGVKP